MNTTDRTKSGHAKYDSVTADESADVTAANSIETSHKSPTRMSVPATAQPIRLLWRYSIALMIVHLLALLAFVPWLFSWTGVILAVLGHFVFGMLGITIGYHRLLTHQGFTCPKWLEYTFAMLGICCLQDSPARWVAVHRMHHKHSDEQPDPHSPFVGFFWSHVGWLLVANRDHDHVTHYERYARDLLRDRFYLRLERYQLWFYVYGAHVLLFLLGGLAFGWLATGQYFAGLQFGLSLLVWGVFVRTVFVLHGTWAVNSVTHLWGYQNYNTGDNSRNHWLVALLSHGEGWHNNHHADQRSAQHGHKWWEFDMAYRVICILELVGLAKDVKRPNKPSAST